MTGKSHTDSEATAFALKVMQYLNNACKEWREETNIDFSLYGSGGGRDSESAFAGLYRGAYAASRGTVGILLEIFIE